MAACFQDAGDSVAPKPEAAPVSIEIVGASQGHVGDTIRLSAVVRDSVGDTLRSADVTWSGLDTVRIPFTRFAIQSHGKSIPIGIDVKPARIATSRFIATIAGLSDTIIFTSTLPPYTFTFADTASETDRRLIFDGIQDAHNFQRAVFEKTLADSIVISGVYAGQGCANGGAAAFASGRAVTFCLGNQGWKTHGPVVKQKIVQHELFHLWQFAHWSTDPAKSPAWLIEGSAELMGYYGVAQRGFLSFETALGCQRKESADFTANQPPGLPPLENVESRQVFQSTVGPLYTHSMIGAHYLAESGDGLASLEKYGDLVKTSVTWQSAFGTAFKMTPAFFYGAFPGYVSGLSVPPTYACRI